VTENRAPRGHRSPLPVHHNEDEWFHVLSGELTTTEGLDTPRCDGAVVVPPFELTD
jgi:uncharacterized cupin superfamily protein